MTKKKGEWSRELLKEVVLSDTEVWRAEKSVAPDGTEFLSVRRVLIKKDGSVIYLKDGVTAQVGDKANTLFKALRVLLPIVTSANEDPAQEAPVYGRYVLAQGSKLLVSVESPKKGGTKPVVVSTAESERQAKTFAMASSAVAFRDEWLSQEPRRWRVARFDPVERQISKGKS